MRQFISRDAVPSNRVVTATVPLSISDEERKYTLILELYDLEAQNVQQYRLPLPELAVSASYPDLTILNHVGKYEVVKRIEGMPGSEQRRVFTVENVND